MKCLPWALSLLLLGCPISVSAQSLVEVAKREKERRQRLKEQSPRSRTGSGPSTDYSDDNTGGIPVGTISEPGTDADDEQQKRDREVGSIVLASFVDQETSPSDESKKDVQFIRAGGGAPTGASGGPPQFRMPGRSTSNGLYLRGAFYADWFRAVYDNGLSTSQFSGRIKMMAGRRPGDGWRAYLDVRDRFNNTQSRNQAIIYDARMIYEDIDSPIELSLGQMNLFNSVGVGQLLGGVLGYHLNSDWTAGGYGGLEPNLYTVAVDPDYQKYGFYLRYRGDGAKTAAVSYNAVRFQGEAEREFLYTSALLPFSDVAVLFGNLEYELGNNLTGADRLSYLFLNARYNFTQSIDVTAHFSSGKGLDFHRFLVEQSQNPNRNSPELERFYYSQSYGVRFSVKPHRRLRIYVAQRESEQKDRFIRNHTTQFGSSALNVAGTGISAYGNYNINRGDASESDSYQISLSRSFGRLSWTAYYSSTFNGIRFDASTGLPQIVRISDRNTVSNDVFFTITRALALSLQHDYSSQGAANENTLFFRVIYRF